VLDVLLQVLTTAADRREGADRDFKNTVIIMTSNLGSHFLAEHTLRDGTLTEAPSGRCSSLAQHFRPSSSPPRRRGAVPSARREHMKQISTSSSAAAEAARGPEASVT